MSSVDDVRTELARSGRGETYRLSTRVAIVLFLVAVVVGISEIQLLATVQADDVRSILVGAD